MNWYKTLILSLFAKTWEDVQLYCRKKQTDLATFESIEEVNQLNRPATISEWPWFGRHDDPSPWRGTLGNDSNSWRWLTTGQEISSQYHKWLCASLESSLKWRDAACEYKIGCYCYTDMGQNQTNYVFVSENRSWYETHAYCRQHFTDLAVGTGEAWTGPYRIPWTWSDTSALNFTEWLEGQPNYYYDHEHSASGNEGHLWSNSLCTDLNHFIYNEVGCSVYKSKVD